MPTVRRATHAGSWYSSHGKELARELSGWLAEAQEETGPARAIIAPHAGFSYSGPTAASAYKHVKPAGVRVSVGYEELEDIKADFEQAFEASSK